MTQVSVLLAACFAHAACSIGSKTPIVQDTGNLSGGRIDTLISSSPIEEISLLRPQILPAGLEWHVSAPSKVAPKTLVALSIVIVNHGQSAIGVWLPGSADPLVEFVISKNGIEVWDSLHGQEQDLMTTRSVIPANDSLVIGRQWDQRSNRGAYVGAGVFQITGYIVPPVGGTSGWPAPPKQLTIGTVSG